MVPASQPQGSDLTLWDRTLKRGLDIIAAILALGLTCWITAIAFVLATIDTRRIGFFCQTRIGRDGRPFRIIKIRTMRAVSGIDTTVTTDADPRITPLGRIFRKAKVDELPQFINVLLGHMSLVGPRPDVPDVAAALSGRDRIILSVQPGITGPATLKYRDEAQLLARQPDPERYNQEVIVPDKIRINRAYVENYSFSKDLKYLCATICRRPIS